MAIYCSTFIEIQSKLRWRKKLHRTNQGSNFLGDKCSNRDNVRAPINPKIICEPQHLKWWFFLKKRPIHFHINSNNVVRPIKWSQVIFSLNEINKLVPTQSTVSYRSDSSSEANSSCCYRSTVPLNICLNYFFCIYL